MKIDIISDTVCPWCFIGKKRLERALGMRPDLTTQITWYPFQLNPDMPNEGMERQLYLNLKFGGEERAKETYQSVHEASASEHLNLQLSQIKRMPNSLQSHRLLYYAKKNGVQNEVAENLFQSYFLYGEDIGSLPHLVEIALKSGISSSKVQSYLSSDEDLDLIKEQDMQSRKMGISGVPCFIIEDEYAISGAQEPEVFLQVFDAAKELAV